MNIRTNAPVLLLGVIAGIACGLFQSRGSAEQVLPVVKAHQFELVDRSGKTRIRLSVDPQNEGAGVSIFDGTSSVPRILIGTLSDGSCLIALKDADGNARAELNLKQASVRLSLVDPALKGGVVLGSTGDITALVFNDDTSTHRATLGLTPAKEPSLTMYDEKGHPVWSTPAAATK